MGTILFSAKHKQFPLRMSLVQSYLQIFHTYAALTASPFVYMYNPNLITSQPGLTGCEVACHGYLVYRSHLQSFKKNHISQSEVQTKFQKNNRGIKISQLLAICYQWDKS